MQLTIAVSKVDKWAVRQGGDTIEVIERPHGGISVVLVDGQSSGPGAKAISSLVVRKVVADLAEGVRDGAAARAANDVLHAMRGGKVSASLVILSVDLHSRSVVLTRCGNAHVYVRRTSADPIARLTGQSSPLGFYRHTRPSVDQVALTEGLLVCACTDGLVNAGSRAGAPLDLPATLAAEWDSAVSAQAYADRLLARAWQADAGRPTDDTSIVVLHVGADALASDRPAANVRRMVVEMPVTAS